MRVGRKKNPLYRIVAVDSRRKRDGAYLELIGSYQPRLRPAKIQIDEEKVLRWLQTGAIPSDTVRNLLSQQGIMLKFDLLKRNTPADQIAEVTSRWQTEAAQRAAEKAARPKRKGKKQEVETAPATEGQES
jgi:small subunit ribosomal protein S16